MEFQAVIMAGGHGSRIYQLTGETGSGKVIPKALLRVGNLPLISYPVRLLERWGFEEVIVVVLESAAATISAALFKLKSSIRFDVVQIEDRLDMGTADSLRHIAPKIKTDVLVISCDLVSNVCLQSLADMHRKHDAAATVLLATPALSLPEAGSASSRGQRIIVGLDSDQRLMCLAHEADLEEQELPVRMSLLRRHPNFMLHTTLSDAHLYLLRKWVVDYVAANESLSSLQGEVLPILVEKQFSSQSLQPRTPSGVSTPGGILSGYAPDPSNIHSYVPVDEWSSDINEMTSSSSATAPSSYSCYAYIMKQGVCVRANSFALYCDLNKQIYHNLSLIMADPPARIHPSATIKPKSKTCSDSMVGMGSSIGEKCQIKKTIIGEHCVIGERVKITNSVIMDHVTIKDNCNLHGVVVSSNAYINENCSLKDCQVAQGYTVAEKSEVRGEALGSGMTADDDLF